MNKPTIGKPEIRDMDGKLLSDESLRFLIAQYGLIRRINHELMGLCAESMLEEVSSRIELLKSLKAVYQVQGIILAIRTALPDLTGPYALALTSVEESHKRILQRLESAL